MEKEYINPGKLYQLSTELGSKVLKDVETFKPNWIIGLWRGGAPVGVVIQGFLKYHKIITDHISVRTSSYNQDGKQSEIRIHGLEYVIKKANRDSKVLIVDDIFDSGRSIDALLKKLERKMRQNFPINIKIATVFWKPKNNKTLIKPDYYCLATEKWIVFPHEYDDLTEKEIEELMGKEISNLFKKQPSKMETI